MSAWTDLLAQFRVEADDGAAPYLWDDAYALAIATDAQNEAAERALLIEEETDDDVCLVAWQAGWTRATLDTSIIQVRTVTWNGRYLTGISSDELVEQHPRGWMQLEGGTPSHFIDPQQHYLTLFRKPIGAGTVRLTVYRRPILAIDSDGFEIPPHLVPKLLDWMLARAYGKRDSDGYDANLSAKHEGKFTATFGERLDESVRRQQRARTKNRISFNPTW